MLNLSSRTAGPIVLTVIEGVARRTDAARLGGGGMPGAQSEREALDLLRSVGTDPRTTAGLRDLVRELEPQFGALPMSQEEVIRVLARAIAAGRLAAVRGRSVGDGGSAASTSSTGGASAASSDAPVAAPLGVYAPIATSQVVTDPTVSVTPWPTSAAASAPEQTPPPSAAVVAAADAAAAAASDAANTDAESQAATLQQAAESGVPFCEECEKAAATAATGGGSA